jgi:GAF domain-containing protein
MVADVFLATDNLHEEDEAVAAKQVLDLANQHVEAEASSIFFSDMNSALKDLIIVEASGPVANKIKGIHVPVGKGIVGFCVQNGVKLTVNSVQQNPNFYGKLDQEFGFRTSSILCVPIQHGSRTYGAIELINKKGDGKWSTNDANVLESLGMILGRAIETRLEAKND